MLLDTLDDHSTIVESPKVQDLFRQVTERGSFQALSRSVPFSQMTRKWMSRSIAGETLSCTVPCSGFQSRMKPPDHLKPQPDLTSTPSREDGLQTSLLILHTESRAVRGVSSCDVHSDVTYQSSIWPSLAHSSVQHRRGSGIAKKLPFFLTWEFS